MVYLGDHSLKGQQVGKVARLLQKAHNALELYKCWRWDGGVDEIS